jgi:hypothetical protein
VVSVYFSFFNRTLKLLHYVVGFDNCFVGSLDCHFINGSADAGMRKHFRSQSGFVLSVVSCSFNRSGSVVVNQIFFNKAALPLGQIVDHLLNVASIKSGLNLRLNTIFRSLSGCDAGFKFSQLIVYLFSNRDFPYLSRNSSYKF